MSCMVWGLGMWFGGMMAGAAFAFMYATHLNIQHNRVCHVDHQQERSASVAKPNKS